VARKTTALLIIQSGPKSKLVTTAIYRIKIVCQWDWIYSSN